MTDEYQIDGETYAEKDGSGNLVIKNIDEAAIDKLAAALDANGQNINNVGSVSTEIAEISETVDHSETYSATVADGASATLTAEFSDGSQFGGCKLYIIVQFSNQLSLTSAYQYERLHVDVDESIYNTVIETVGDGSTGNFQVSDSDFSIDVSDPSTIEVTYSNNNGSGKDNIVYFFLFDSVNFVSASVQ